ncbi:hypothetical protein IVB22_32430 [Bradyrhizobium sp. 190]|uniref:hypothetical protein n=1 Tax=Bradyrhizobium sp. 190 TaxID=2782658 RepID=UPI001FFC1B5B|nr:hypothetical protein [Bradyrhizobium sp. 190]MCK1517130.1 hypothetical protein [Bradyrhizobium sp. 190]
MNNPTTNANVSIDQSTPFCAHTYYACIQAKGCDPIIRNGGLYIDLCSASIGDVGRWAALHDPDGSLRLDHARSAWEKRASDDEIIMLGVRQ